MIGNQANLGFISVRYFPRSPLSGNMMLRWDLTFPPYIKSHVAHLIRRWNVWDEKGSKIGNRASYRTIVFLCRCGLWMGSIEADMVLEMRCCGNYLYWNSIAKTIKQCFPTQHLVTHHYWEFSILRQQQVYTKITSGKHKSMQKSSRTPTSKTKNISVLLVP